MNSNTYLPFLLETGRGTRLNYIFQKSAAGSRARSENPFDPLTPLLFSDTPQLQIRFNPPFSLFREYVAQLMEYKKDFIIIGNQNAITYKEIFPLFMQNKIWYGASIHSHGRDFRVPDDYPLQAYEFRTDENGRTGKKNVYAGGDAVTGAATVILAMGAGKTGARSIDAYIRSKS